MGLCVVSFYLAFSFINCKSDWTRHQWSKVNHRYGPAECCHFSFTTTTAIRDPPWRRIFPQSIYLSFEDQVYSLSDVGIRWMIDGTLALCIVLTPQGVRLFVYNIVSNQQLIRYRTVFISMIHAFTFVLRSKPRPLKAAKTTQLLL